MRNSQVWAWFAALVVVTAAVCWMFSRVTSPAPFAYDEADYMYAGTQGFAANYLDYNSMSLKEYVLRGLELKNDKTQRGAMSQLVRGSGDISFYRHYHGPMYACWISLWHALGTRSEAGYRAAGLWIHAAGAFAIFWLFLITFPELPVVAAFAAALLFVMNRTALVTGMFITQHVLFEALAVLALFTTALFLKTNNNRWWYATAALLACGFATVEITVVLIAAILLAVAWVRRKEGLVSLLKLIGIGAIWFLGTLLVTWPKGLLQLNALKGYLYLAYMTIYRKTFIPISPLDLWGFKIVTYPLEFVPLLAALAVIIVFWRKLSVRTALLPFAIFAVMFLLVTMVITIPFTYYHAALLATLAVIGGAAIGELWKRRPAAGAGVLAVMAIALIIQARSYYQESAKALTEPSLAAGLLAHLDHSPQMSKLYVPFFLLPPVHFYHPSVAVVGYDNDWTAERLANESAAAAPMALLCADEVCKAVEPRFPAGTIVHKTRIGEMQESGEPVFALNLEAKP